MEYKKKLKCAYLYGVATRLSERRRALPSFSESPTPHSSLWQRSQNILIRVPSPSILKNSAADSKFSLSISVWRCAITFSFLETLFAFLVAKSRKTLIFRAINSIILSERLNKCLIVKKQPIVKLRFTIDAPLCGDARIIAACQNLRF